MEKFFKKDKYTNEEILEENRKKIKELTENQTDIMLVTNEGILLAGDTPTLLSLYAMLNRRMLELNKVDKEILKSAFDLSFFNDEQLEELYNKLYKRLKEKLLKIGEN